MEPGIALCQYFLPRITCDVALDLVDYARYNENLFSL